MSDIIPYDTGTFEWNLRPRTCKEYYDDNENIYVSAAAYLQNQYSSWPYKIGVSLSKAGWHDSVTMFVFWLNHPPSTYHVSCLYMSLEQDGQCGSRHSEHDQPPPRCLLFMLFLVTFITNGMLTFFLVVWSLSQTQSSFNIRADHYVCSGRGAYYPIFLFYTHFYFNYFFIKKFFINILFFLNSRAPLRQWSNICFFTEESCDNRP